MGLEVGDGYGYLGTGLLSTIYASNCFVGPFIYYQKRKGGEVGFRNRSMMNKIRSDIHL